MAETVILLAIKKIGIALGNEAANQATAQFAKYVTQLSELQVRMGRVMRELRVMHDFLCQMDIRNRSNQVYEGWLEEVRKVVYVIEDMVDEYMYLVGQEHHVGWRFYLKKGFKKPKALLSLNKIASMVKETEGNLIHLSQTKERWVPTINNGDTSSSSYIVQKSHDLASISRSLGEEDLVGIEDNKQTLVQWLGDDELARSMIVLHGMGGLGKTALAATVYKEERHGIH